MLTTSGKIIVSLLVAVVILISAAFLLPSRMIPPPEPTEAPIATPAPPETAPPATVAPETTAPPASTESDSTEAEKLVVPFDFTAPVPASDAVADDYFADAAFIGDSRTDGFILFSGIRGAGCYYGNGLTIFGLDEVACIRSGDQKITIYDALAQKQYKKIYLSLGINELGYYDDAGYYEAYRSAVDEIRRLQPEAVLYLQGLMPLNEQKIHDKGGASYLKNDHLLIYNDLIRQVAEEKNIPFLDLNAHFKDENGELPYDASRDGVHPVREYYEQWYAYLKTHTVAPESLIIAPETEELI